MRGWPRPRRRQPRLRRSDRRLRDDPRARRHAGHKARRAIPLTSRRPSRERADSTRRCQRSSRSLPPLRRSTSAGSSTGVPPTSASRGRRTAARPGACRAFFRASPSTPARRAPLSGGSADQSHDILGREDVDVGPMVWTGFSTSVIQPVGRDLRSMLIESHYDRHRGLLTLHGLKRLRGLAPRLSCGGPYTRARTEPGRTCHLSSHARTSPSATSDTTKQVRPTGRQPRRESARRRSGPSPRRRTSPTTESKQQAAK